MKNLLAIFFLVVASPLWAAEAIFADGVLRLDAVRVGADVYETELVVTPNSDPMTFTLTNARKLTGVADVAATFAGTALTIPNVLVNGKQRFSAQLSLVGSDPFRFRLASASLLRGVSFPLEGQTVAAEQFLTLTYTGAALDKDKVKLTIGGTELSKTVTDNTIVASAPNIAGAATLQIELDGAKFSFPITISGIAPILNPRSYVSTFADELDATLRQARLPSTLLDLAAIQTELAKLSDSDARLLAEQLRANLGPLLQDIGSTGGISLQAIKYFTTSEELDKWCVATGKVYVSRVKQVAIAGLAMVYFAEVGQPAGALISAAAMGALAGGALNTRSETLNFGCYDVSSLSSWERIQPLYDSVTLAQELEFFEDRPQALQLTEVRTVRSGEFANLYLEASKTLVDIAKKVKNAILIVPFISDTSTVVVYVDNIIATINVEGVEEVEDRASKYKVRSVSDSTISVDMMTIAGSTIFVFNQVVGDIPTGQSIRFTLELYNEEDDITMRVPILLRAASMLEDLKSAVLGRWTVTNIADSGERTDYVLELRPDGKGAYILPLVPQDTVAGTYCKKYGYAPFLSGTRVGNDCEYPVGWSVERSGEAYTLKESNSIFIHDEGAGVVRTPISLPLTGFNAVFQGRVIRNYVKQ